MVMPVTTPRMSVELIAPIAWKRLAVRHP
jgi:hypothetical protein